MCHSLSPTVSHALAHYNVQQHRVYMVQALEHCEKYRLLKEAKNALNPSQPRTPTQEVPSRGIDV